MTARTPSPGSSPEERRLFRDLVESSPDLLIVVGSDLEIRYASPSVREMLGYEVESLIGENLSGYLYHAALEEPRDGTPVGDGTAGASSSEGLEFSVRHADGSWRHLEAVSAGLASGQDERAYYVRDVTRRKAVEQDLIYRAFHDHLTGLANRALFMDRLEHALVLTIRREAPITVLFVDLDNFKTVNDDFGHGVGDMLLTMVGQRLRACLRPGDTVARFGGDEFVVLLEDAARAGNAANVANRIAAALREPISWSGHTFFVTASVGVASSGPNLKSAEEILRAADSAMYRAKEAGKARHEVFERGLPAEKRGYLRLESDLKRAVERGEFRLHYQPEVDLGTGATVSMEALLRWEHPRRGTIYPLQFVTLAEENGLIVPIGRWVLGEACRRAVLWRADGAQPSVSVNLSARQLQQPGLTEGVAGILGETGLPPEALILEITESLLVEDTERVAETLGRLKEIGVRLAIDDFGTGYSALSYLERFPADYLKIDQAFIRSLADEDAVSTALLPLLVNLTQALGMEAIAEGVETEDQAARLRELGCDVAQGYHFSAPLADEAVSEFLRREALT